MSVLMHVSVQETHGYTDTTQQQCFGRGTVVLKT